MIDGKNEEQEESNKVNFVAGNAKGGMPRVVRKELDEIRVKVDNALYDVPSTDLSGLSTEDYVSTTVSDALTDYATTSSLNNYSPTTHTHDGDYSIEGHTHSDYYKTDGSQSVTGFIKILRDNPTVQFLDTNNRSAHIHVNSNKFYILRGSGTQSTGWSTYNDTWPLVINLENNNATFGGDINMRAVHANRPFINRVGGVFFTWDSDSYGTNTHHSIRSTYGDGWTDCITINSFGHVRINIDSNSNGGNNFEIGSHTTDTGNRILYVPDTGSGIHLEQGWYRTFNKTGWYSETYQGGIYMTDTTWVRTYNSKGLHSPSNIDASGYVYAGDQFRAFKSLSLTNGSWNYQQAHIRLDCNNSALAISGHPHGGVANQFIWATGSSTIYVRNWNNLGYAAIEGIIYNSSHSSYKKNISPLRAKSVGAAASKTVLSDTLKKIDLVEYELKPENSDAGLIPDRWETTVWDDELEREVNVPNERRQRAYQRLNEIRGRAGLEPYNRVHECGKDCDSTPEKPCKITRNANMRIPGFLAEQAVEHIPGVIAVNDEGEGHSVNLLALSGFLMGVVQELVDRVDELESKKTDTDAL